MARHQPFSCRLFFPLAPLLPKSFRLAAPPPGRATSVFRAEFPTRTTIYKNIVTDLGADPTGKVDASPIINRAIGSCPVGQVVYMPAGIFKIATPISTTNKSNFTLRGAGQGQTILRVTTNVTPISSRGLSPWPPPDSGPSITAGATRGSNTITVSKTSNFAVDMLFTIGPTSVADMGA